MRALAAALLLAGATEAAYAQQPVPPAPPPSAPPVHLVRPVSGFVVDARGVLAKFGQRPEAAQGFGVKSSDLPGPGLGGSLGAHVYIARFGPMAIGVGGEIMMARRGRQPLDDKAEPLGPRLQARVVSMAPQVSFNFGHRNGWSFVSGGMGAASFETFAETGENPNRRVRAINYGGGARWFTSPHLAFTVDLRFYAISPGLVTDTTPERRRQRLMMLSAGVSVR